MKIELGPHERLDDLILDGYRFIGSLWGHS